jgi:hypothetical protein
MNDGTVTDEATQRRPRRHVVRQDDVQRVAHLLYPRSTQRPGDNIYTQFFRPVAFSFPSPAANPRFTPVENLSKTRAQRVEKLCAKKYLRGNRASFVAKPLHARRFVPHFACPRAADA